MPSDFKHNNNESGREAHQIDYSNKTRSWRKRNEFNHITVDETKTNLRTEYRDSASPLQDTNRKISSERFPQVYL